MKFSVGANIGHKITKNVFEMPTTYQPNLPKLMNHKDLSFWVFHWILMKFGMTANIGQKTTKNELEIASAIF